MKFINLLLLFAALAFVVGGCSDDDNPANPGTPTTTTYVGVMAGTGVSGTLTISIPSGKRAWSPVPTAADTVEITATLKINGGATIALDGFIVISTGEIFLAGGGYTFNGYLVAGTVSGTFAYAGGTGIFNCDEGTAANVKTFCGRYQDNSPGTEAGYFNMTISGSTIFVIVYPDDAGGAAFTTSGTINAEGGITIHHPENSALTIATGTLASGGASVSGFYAGDPGGTWSGAPCN